MLISVGMSLSGGWLNEAVGIGTSPNPSMTGFDVMGASLIFMMLCWQVPKLFAGVLGGSPALSGGDLVSTRISRCDLRFRIVRPPCYWSSVQMAKAR
jgi:hypothetical protein